MDKSVGLYVAAEAHIRSGLILILSMRTYSVGDSDGRGWDGDLVGDGGGQGVVRRTKNLVITNGRG